MSSHVLSSIPSSRIFGCVLATSAATPASAAPTVVQFEAKGGEADVEALRVSLDDWLRPMKLTLRRVQALPTGIDDTQARLLAHDYVAGRPLANVVDPALGY